jgi:serine/threonine protein kinase
MLTNVQMRFCLVDTLKIGIQLINMIERMHNIGYIHNDIKPDNILIGDYSHILHDAEDSFDTQNYI